MEITETEQKKEKRMKRNEDNLRDLWTTSKILTLHYRGPRRRRERKGQITYIKT